MFRGIARSVGFVVLFVLGVWLVGELFGFQIGLVGTLIGSIALTVIANLVLGGFQKLRR